MVVESFVIYIVAVVLILIVLAVLIVTCFRQKDLQNSTTVEDATRHRRYINRGGQIVLTNQQEDIYNISSRVQGQEQGQWPTHDNHVSLDHFTITNEINKYNDDPPTYEEAMRIAASNNNNTVVAAVPKTNVTPTSTSTSTANQ
ncbi:uncharacterized protein LOC123011321 isoform X2 [Tribolium madens]|uniref:uncharacterized protein LOC123011321 isoform X2 n=1 Tax=Tribolium madens TaxID=41895 RepID=UPI001CF74D0D|nr:uncharacterized protein LOC123011321 isoform X2 [Tribolium madens]